MEENKSLDPWGCEMDEQKMYDGSGLSKGDKIRNKGARTPSSKGRKKGGKKQGKKTKQYEKAGHIFNDEIIDDPLTQTRYLETGSPILRPGQRLLGVLPPIDPIGGKSITGCPQSPQTQRRLVRARPQSSKKIYRVHNVHDFDDVFKDKYCQEPQHVQSVYYPEEVLDYGILEKASTSRRAVSPTPPTPESTRSTLDGHFDVNEERRKLQDDINRCINYGKARKIPSPDESDLNPDNAPWLKKKKKRHRKKSSKKHRDRKHGGSSKHQDKTDISDDHSKEKKRSSKSKSKKNKMSSDNHDSWISTPGSTPTEYSAGANKTKRPGAARFIREVKEMSKRQLKNGTDGFFDEEYTGIRVDKPTGSKYEKEIALEDHGTSSNNIPTNALGTSKNPNGSVRLGGSTVSIISKQFERNKATIKKALAYSISGSTKYTEPGSSSKSETKKTSDGTVNSKNKKASRSSNNSPGKQNCKRDEKGSSTINNSVISGSVSQGKNDPDAKKNYESEKNSGYNSNFEIDCRAGPSKRSESPNTSHFKKSDASQNGSGTSRNSATHKNTEHTGDLETKKCKVCEIRENMREKQENSSSDESFCFEAPDTNKRAEEAESYSVEAEYEYEDDFESYHSEDDDDESRPMSSTSSFSRPTSSVPDQNSP